MANFCMLLYTHNYYQLLKGAKLWVSQQAQKLILRKITVREYLLQSRSEWSYMIGLICLISTISL